MSIKEKLSRIFSKESLGSIPSREDLSNIFSKENMASVLGGVSSVYSASEPLRAINNTGNQLLDIQEIGNFGERNYNNYDQLQSEYESLQSYQPDLSFDTIRGSNEGDRLKGILGSAAAGASAGSFAGPYGILAGGAIGGAVGLVSNEMGNHKARIEKDFLGVQNDIANRQAKIGLNYNTDNLSDLQSRSAMVHRAEKGGQIQRKPISAKEFADAVLNKQRKSDTTKSSNVVRQHCKGGTMIRIKK